MIYPNPLHQSSSKLLLTLATKEVVDQKWLSQWWVRASRKWVLFSHAYHPP